MLKIRLMGTKKDIEWFGQLLRECKQVEVKEFSNIYSNKGTNNYFRAYVEISSKKKD